MLGAVAIPHLLAYATAAFFATVQRESYREEKKKEQRFSGEKRKLFGGSVEVLSGA